MKTTRYLAFVLCVLFTACICCACSPAAQPSLVGSWESACNHHQNEKNILTFSEDGTMLIETFKYDDKLYEIPGTYSLEVEHEIKFRLEGKLFDTQNGSWLYLIEGDRLYLSHDRTPVDTKALEQTEQYYIRRQAAPETDPSSTQ